MLVSIIIPAYKQEATIKRDVENIYFVMSQTRWDFELIVVVDGILDKTFDEASHIHKENIRIHGYKTNKGKGYAVRYGMARSKGDYIVFIDAGMDINANGISMILEHMVWYNADIIVGSKRHPASKVNYPFFRKIYSFGYHFIIKLLFGLRIKDTQTGLKVFRRAVLEKTLPRLLVKKFAFDIELLTVANYLGFCRIYEAPVEIVWDVTNTNFGGDTFLLFDKKIHAMLLDTLAVFYRMHFLNYYHDENERKWVYDKELDMRVNTGEMASKILMDGGTPVLK